MTDFLNEFLVSQAAPASLAAFAINFVLTGILSGILGVFYVRYGHSLSNRRAFAANFVVLGMTTMLIITIVKSSLALSLGLVGALSIVRFRSAIKEPEELSYLFLIIAIGLGFGADQGQITLLGFGLVLALVFLRHLRRPAAATDALVLSIAAPGPQGLELEQIVAVLRRHCTAMNLRRFDQTDAAVESSFVVEVGDFESLLAATREIRELHPQASVSFVDNRGLA